MRIRCVKKSTYRQEAANSKSISTAAAFNIYLKSEYKLALDEV